MNSPGIARTNTFNAGLSSSQSMGDIYTLKIEDVKGNMLLSGPAESSMMITNWSLAVDLPVDMNVANSTAPRVVHAFRKWHSPKRSTWPRQCSTRRALRAPI